MNPTVTESTGRPGLVGQSLLLAIGVAGAATVFLFVWRFATNFPAGDDWDLLLTLLAWQTDGVTTASLLSFHNEHRIIATRVVDGLLLPHFDGNLKVAILGDSLLVIATLTVLWSFLARERTHVLFLAFAYAAVCALVSGWFQWQNLLWAFQLPWLLMPLLLASAIWCLCFVRNDVLCVAAVAALLVVAYCCQSNGVIVWLATIPAVLARSHGRSLRFRAGLLIGLLALVLAAGAAYFIGLPVDVARSDVGTAFVQPGRYVHFFLAVLGSPFSSALSLIGPERWVGVTAGSIGLVAASFLVPFASKHGRGSDRQAVLVLGLGLLLFSTASVAAIALGRFARFSPDQIESRYTTFALYFYVGLVLLFLSVIGRDLTIGRRTGSLRSAFLLTCVGMVAAGTWGDTLFAAHALNLHLAQLRAKASLNLSRALPDRSELVGQSHTVSLAQLPTLLDALEDHHLWVPHRITAVRPSDLQDDALIGNVDEVVDRGDRVMLKGWSRLPDALPADAIVAMVRDPNGMLVPVAMSAAQRAARPDLIGAFNGDVVPDSGWSLEMGKADYARMPVIAAFSIARNAFYTIPFQPKLLPD